MAKSSKKLPQTPVLRQGFIYTIFNFIVSILLAFNPFEWFKALGALRAKGKSELEIINAKRTYGDLFILIKWVIIIAFVQFRFENTLTTFICWWLIVANLFSFFYYLVWKQYPTNHVNDPSRGRRRFIHLIIALFFSNVCFAYLYSVPYKEYFVWQSHGANFWDAMQFSISNSIAGNYTYVEPLYGIASSLCMIQFLITFLFVSILLSRSIPE